ncbi:MAG: 2-amino-4-hydroxy-6-hydroxymethyldihydropteridine diphosphokinase [Candidatus Cloacimonetes bacterium]|nr:2-amino-4-hydroxy-6-hydroxymethyldihydropteridine diphosphokinase [Candidatus Cloacimonadota bacterium]
MNYFLGLGTNIGDLSENLDIAIFNLSQIKDVTILKKSSYYKTKPWGYKEQEDFLNAVVLLICEYEPEDFLSILRDIESQMGKKIICKWGPRLIDIDILFCDDLIFESEKLIIPHPRLHERDFVLLPMLEIAPDFVHPVLKKKIGEMCLKGDLCLKLE